MWTIEPYYVTNRRIISSFSAKTCCENLSQNGTFWRTPFYLAVLLYLLILPARRIGYCATCPKIYHLSLAEKFFHWRKQHWALPYLISSIGVLGRSINDILFFGADLHLNKFGDQAVILMAVLFSNITVLLFGIPLAPNLALSPTYKIQRCAWVSFFGIWIRVAAPARSWDDAFRNSGSAVYRLFALKKRYGLLSFRTSFSHPNACM